MKDVDHIEIILDHFLGVPSIAKNSTIFLGQITLTATFIILYSNFCSDFCDGFVVIHGGLVVVVHVGFMVVYGCFMVIHGGLVVVVHGDLWWFSHGGFVVVHGGLVVVVHGGLWWFSVVVFPQISPGKGHVTLYRTNHRP